MELIRNYKQTFNFQAANKLLLQRMSLNIMKVITQTGAVSECVLGREVALNLRGQ